MRLIRLVLLGALISFIPSSARAQAFEQAGVRAQGMGGAFVAVADDASAVWWNPAGLADGPFFNALLEYQQQPEPGSRVSALAIGTPPLGASYRRVRAVLPAEEASNGRQTESGVLHAATLVTHEAGFTLLHSLTTGFVFGSTLKFVHGTVDDRGTNKLDLDVGVHYRAGPLRAGFVVRSLAEPSFATPGGGQLTPSRHARAGIAWAGETTTLATDVDLTDVEAPWEGRRIAMGGEHRFGHRVAARAGVRLRASDGPDPWVSFGGSYALKPGIWMDGFWGRSPDQDARWGIAGRVVY